MKQINRLYMLICTALFMAIPAIGQDMAENPIKWRMSVKMTSADTGTVTMRAILSPGWHLYGTRLPKNGPVPTTFDFSESQGVKFTDDFKPSHQPLDKKDPNFDMTLNWWEGDVTFTRNFKLTGTVTDAEIIGKVKFMGCNDANCLPPKTLSFKSKPKPFKSAK